MQLLINQIEQWAEDRNLINGSTPQKQMLKLMEEFGELCSGIAKNKPEVIKDSIGDCFVVLVILNKQLKGNSDFIPVKEVYETNVILSANDIIMILGDIRHIVYHIKSAPVVIKNLKELVGLLLGELSYISNHYDLTLYDCVQHAYNQIKDRKRK